MAENVTPDAPAVEVFAVYGVEPEVQAYAMAKYSRSALSMKESLKEISQQKAEKFLNTFYFQYGHRSIADLAHIALAIERLSILAAIAVADAASVITRKQTYRAVITHPLVKGAYDSRGSIQKPDVSGIRKLSAANGPALTR